MDLNTISGVCFRLAGEMARMANYESKHQMMGSEMSTQTQLENERGRHVCRMG